MQTRQRGTAIVEFALVLPLLLLLTMITTEFGRAIYQYNTIVKSVRQATRYLSLQTPTTKTTEAQNLVKFGNLTGTPSVPLVLGIDGTTVSITPTWQLQGSDPVINTVTITVSGYKFRPLFASVFGVTFSDGNGDISFGNISATMRCSS
ncbi:Flp pilus assembly protein TadG [Georgfuchsia toluolica]|uniref:Flp pilus assembly protein TadG n=1 Tax=Georgfuchsia toluolica TaxID=424218 RepID=A0A916J311_9PROT|nr:TadE family protein [Georgfuchsia toluolica]CAG4882903.1 Flp pilus assembly protein TadG [Georgfuchsia toluolica]